MTAGPPPGGPADIAAASGQTTGATPRADLLGLTADAFTAWSRSVAGFSPRFHRALYRRLLASGHLDVAAEPRWQEAEASAPGTIARLAAAAARVQIPALATTVAADDPTRGRTVKLAARLADGQEVETVVIPMGHHDGSHADDGPTDRGHWTVCVSSQVGCRMGCSFCHTARMGLRRHLAAHEIIGQVVLAAAVTGVRPRNVVFMGMGEPLDNAEAVAQAVRVLTDRAGLALAHHHITVSTVGRVDVLPRWHDLGLSRVNLAVSLGAADDRLRSELMPVNRTAPLADLKRALLALDLPRGRRVLVACVVIPGVNDGGADADRLAAWLDGLPALVNLIPYNPIPSRPWRAPTADEVTAYRDRLDALGIPVRLRTTKGDTVMAACGQLGRPGRTAGLRTEGNIR
jgi:23S rRNA (adenine2503-C2)-methyltransferase